MTSKSSRNSGGFRAYGNEQRTLRAKLDQLLKWTRDLKSNLMKQSCKVLQANSDSNITCQTMERIHEDLDEYKRKLDRELGRIHDICDALANNLATDGLAENLRDEILEALRRSPTYSSLEQHISDNKGPTIRLKPRARSHPGQNRIPRGPFLSTNTIKRKVSQPIALRLLDTSGTSSTKRRSQVDAFKRSRSFTNVEHTETELGMDYIEEDEDELSWKPFGPKKSIAQVSEICNDQLPSTSSVITKQSPSPEKSKPSSAITDDSSDEEFDVAWERRAKQKARKEVASAPAVVPNEPPAKRTVRFSPSTHDAVDLIELDLDDTTQDGLLQTELVNLDTEDQEATAIPTDTQSQTTTTVPTTSSAKEVHTVEDDSQVIDDSDDDDIIALSDDEIPRKPNILSESSFWTSSEIRISSGNTQSQPMYNPYRVGITDPSIRSVFLPPPKSQAIQELRNPSKRTQSGNRKAVAKKRGTQRK